MFETETERKLHIREELAFEVWNKLREQRTPQAGSKIESTNESILQNTDNSRQLWSREIKVDHGKVKSHGVCRELGWVGISDNSRPEELGWCLLTSGHLMVQTQKF